MNIILNFCQICSARCHYILQTVPLIVRLKNIFKRDRNTVYTITVPLTFSIRSDQFCKSVSRASYFINYLLQLMLSISFSWLNIHCQVFSLYYLSRTAIYVWLVYLNESFFNWIFKKIYSVTTQWNILITQYKMTHDDR